MPGWQAPRDLPPGWAAIRETVLKRDPVCTWPEGCNQPSAEADHKDDPDDHTLPNLQGLCSWHHQRKTITQRRLRTYVTTRRPNEPHPGLINPGG